MESSQEKLERKFEEKYGPDGPDYTLPAPPTKQVRVEKYKGEKEMQKGIQKMLAQGWTVDQSSSRKAMYSLATGIFTRKQIHTVTFVR